MPLQRSPHLAAVILFAVCLPSCSGNDGGSPAGPDAVRGRLVGNWLLLSTNRPSNPSGVGIATKTFTEDLWEVNQNDPVTGAVVFRHGGHYTLSGSDCVEYVDFACPSTAYLVGQIFTFTVTFDGNTHRQVGLCCSGGGGAGGPNTLLDSVWRRLP